MDSQYIEITNLNRLNGETIIADVSPGNSEPFKFGQIYDNNTIISCFVSGFILFFETFFSFDKNNIVSHAGEFLLAHCPALIQT